jgi:NTP pyrophosphatase (non-canonical NTP hydrolase)
VEQTERTFNSLQVANVERDREWDPGGSLDGAFFGVEHAGEVGEVAAEIAALLANALAMIDHAATSGRVANIIKKLVREEKGIRGSRASVEHLAKELADDVITAYLVAMKYKIDLDEAIEQKFNETTRAQGLHVFLDLTSNRRA